MQDRVFSDAGGKARQKSVEEKVRRQILYSEWHYKQDRSLYSQDVDYIEWRYHDGVLRPVAVIEVTCVDEGVPIQQSYLDAIVHRYNEKDMQGKASKHVAEALGVKAFITLFRADMSEFWVYRLSDGKGWYYLTEHDYIRWITNL